ncbi:hypothetical protein IWW55_004084 [Coemansia sp. RSA 2706]|nr:hypothetical protein IWW55_004084 [Coemansia sp. RSA 2706]
MSAASTDSSVYLLRSLDRCEQLLRTEHFSEPLDARQIRRLANIERIIAEACENEYPADTDLEQRISELKRRIDPWVGRKNAVVLASKQPPLQASSEAGDSRLLERIVGEQGESETQTEISSATSASKDALTAERRPQSYASKRSELLGDNEGLRRRG